MLIIGFQRCSIDHELSFWACLQRLCLSSSPVPGLPQLSKRCCCPRDKSSSAILISSSLKMERLSCEQRRAWAIFAERVTVRVRVTKNCLRLKAEMRSTLTTALTAIRIEATHIANVEGRWRVPVIGLGLGLRLGVGFRVRVGVRGKQKLSASKSRSNIHQISKSRG